MPAQEEWRPVVGFPDYAVSNLGRVMSYKGARPREMRRGIGSSGYRQVDLCLDGAVVTKSVHALVCEAFCGPRPEGMQVRHLDGNRENNAASNLAWGSAAENAADRREHGTHANSNKTHCPSGHPYVDSNIYYNRGKRICRTCTLAAVAARYAARKAAKAAQAAEGVAA